MGGIDEPVFPDVISVTFGYNLDRDEVDVVFHERGMKEEECTLMYKCHDTNVFVFDRLSNVPGDVIDFDGTTYPDHHVVFFLYRGAGRFQIISSTEKVFNPKLRRAFHNFGFPGEIEIHVPGWPVNVSLDEKDKFKLMLKEKA